MLVLGSLIQTHHVAGDEDTEEGTRLGEVSLEILAKMSTHT